MWMGARWGGAVHAAARRGGDDVRQLAAGLSQSSALLGRGLGDRLLAAGSTTIRATTRASMPPSSSCSRRTSKTSRATATCPGAKLVTRPTMWLLWAQYFCLSYGWYFYITWLPTYLKEGQGMEIKSNAFMSWLAGLLEGTYESGHNGAGAQGGARRHSAVVRRVRVADGGSHFQPPAPARRQRRQDSPIICLPWLHRRSRAC